MQGVYYKPDEAPGIAAAFSPLRRFPFTVPSTAQLCRFTTSFCRPKERELLLPGELFERCKMRKSNTVSVFIQEYLTAATTAAAAAAVAAAGASGAAAASAAASTTTSTPITPTKDDTAGRQRYVNNNNEDDDGLAAAVAEEEERQARKIKGGNKPCSRGKDNFLSRKWHSEPSQRVFAVTSSSDNTVNARSLQLDDDDDDDDDERLLSYPLTPTSSSAPVHLKADPLSTSTTATKTLLNNNSSSRRQKFKLKRAQAVDLPRPLEPLEPPGGSSPSRCDSSPPHLGESTRGRVSVTCAPPFSHSSSSSSSSPQCDLLQAYTEALNFHEELKEEYDATKRLFILNRYGRLRSLIRRATIETQLHKLRQATQCQCSCGTRRLGRLRGRQAASMDGVRSKLEELVDMVRPAFRKISASLQTAATSMLPSLATASSQTALSSPVSEPSLTSCSDIPGVHEWHRSRLILLRRHLERLKRQAVCTQRTSLPTTRYKVMKTSLKQVLDARMV